jgi:hypothetical protein
MTLPLFAARAVGAQKKTIKMKAAKKDSIGSPRVRILRMRYDGAIASRCACGFQSACGLQFDPRARLHPFDLLFKTISDCFWCYVL